MMYKFVFSGYKSEISDLFKDPEISKAFEEAFTNKYETLINRIREYSNFILSKNDPNPNFSITLSEEDIVSNFKEDLKRCVLHRALKYVFHSNLNVKENILEILQGDFIEACIMGEKLLFVFEEAIMDYKYPETIIPDEVLSNLESEFLKN